MDIVHKKLLVARLDMLFYMISIPIGGLLLWGWKAAILITGVCALVEYCCRHFGEESNYCPYCGQNVKESPDVKSK